MKKILLVTLMAACGGGGSGPVDSGKQLKDLTNSESSAECNYLFDTYPLITVQCPGGGTATKGEDPAKRAADCNGVNNVPAGCTITVGQAEQCISDVYHLTDAQICSPSTSLPPSCAPVTSAACQGAARLTPMTLSEVYDFALKIVD